MTDQPAPAAATTPVEGADDLLLRRVALAAFAYHLHVAAQRRAEQAPLAAPATSPWLLAGRMEQATRDPSRG